MPVLPIAPPPPNEDDSVIDVVMELQRTFLRIEEMKADPASPLNKRALAIALTELETAMLWLANARP